VEYFRASKGLATCIVLEQRLRGMDLRNGTFDSAILSDTESIYTDVLEP
jgi:hypothetical protein